MAITATMVKKLALSLPGAVQSAHTGYPEFRVAKKIFATLDEAGTRSALELTPEQRKCCAPPNRRCFRR